MSKFVRHLLILLLLFRVFSADAMSVAMATDVSETIHVTSVSSGIDAHSDCEHHSMDQTGEQSSGGDHQNAKCLDCCVVAVIGSKGITLPDLPRPPHAFGYEATLVSINLSKVTKPPIF